MKREFSCKPEGMKEAWPGEFAMFSWQDFVLAIPSPLFLATTYKSNGKENACLQSWSTFFGSGGEFICLLGTVHTRGHFYASLKQTGGCVLNFPSSDIYGHCLQTIENNGFEDDEITKSGLTAEKAVTINAPRIKECFLNIECAYLWEREHFEGGGNVVIALRAAHFCMDDARYDERSLGRYGRTGYLYNINSPINPDSYEISPEGRGVIERL